MTATTGTVVVGPSATPASPSATDVGPAAPAAPPARRARARSGGRWRRAPLGTKLALGGVVALVGIAVLAPVLAPASPVTGDTAARLQGPGSPGHLLGTDGQGRDILSRLIWGTRPSLLSGLVPVAVAGTVGTTLGLVAALAGRRTHALIMRTLDVFYAFPAVLLAIAIAAALGSGVSNAIIALSVVLIAPIARVAEGETSQLRQKDFMAAAETSGAKWPAIAVRHVLPNVAPPIVVYCTALVGLSIIYAAGLGFLGLGVAPPTAEWGLMVNDARQYLFTDPMIAVMPAVAIVLAAASFNLLGDGLRDVLDVRSERAA